MIEEQLKQICSNPIVTCGEGATEIDISNSEESLGLIFPEQFRSYLSTIGWLEIEANELYGLGSNIPEHLNIISNTEWERNEAEEPLPKHLIPFLNDGMGNHYCIDINNKHSKVVFWDYELQEQEDIKEKDFLAFIQSLVKECSE